MGNFLLLWLTGLKSSQVRRRRNQTLKIRPCQASLWALSRQMTGGGTRPSRSGHARPVSGHYPGNVKNLYLEEKAVDRVLVPLKTLETAAGS